MAKYFMEEIIFRISNAVRKNTVTYYFFWSLLIYNIAIIIYPLDKTYAQGEYLTIWLRAKNNNTSASIKVGDILELEIWANFGDKHASGLSAFLTFDEKYFKVINLKGDAKIFKPFDFSSGIFMGGEVDNSTSGDPGNDFPGFQLNAVSVIGNKWITGMGKFATFQLKAIDKTPNTVIKFDYDRANHRDTGYIEYPLTYGRFSRMYNFAVKIEGLGVEGIPDVLLLPGQSDNSTVLNNYVTNAPPNLSTLTWSYSLEKDSILINIDRNTSRVTYTASTTWTGRNKVNFTVTDTSMEKGNDTVTVTVTYPPKIVNMPDSIIFSEDTKYESPLLDYFVNDLDNTPGSIFWSVKSFLDSINIAVDNQLRRIYITSKKDWFGNGSVRFFTQDPYGAKDSLTIPIVITPVNDPPVPFLPNEIIIRPSKTDTVIMLNNYVYDVDNPIYSLTWFYAGNNRINITMNPVNGYPTRFTPEPGFLGSERIIFSVTDGIVTVLDTVLVSIGNEQPKIISLPDIIISTDTLIHGYVNLNKYARDDENVDFLNYSASGDTIAKAIIDSRDSVVFTLNNIDQWGVQNVIFKATDRDGGVGSDTMRVVILADNIPTVWGIPDVYLAIGGRDSSIILDNYVWDKDTPKNRITWTSSPTENITVSINPTTHRVLISSSDPSFVGLENVIFRATDPEGHFREDEITVSVYPGDGTPFIKTIPDVRITKTTTDTRSLDQYLVIFPDSLRKNVKWSVSGSISKVSVSVNPQTKIAQFAIGDDPDFIGRVSFTFISTDTISLKFANRTVLVEVVQGKAPVVGDIPDITLISGTIDSSISLNPYVRDADTEVNLIRWVVTGNVNVTVDSSRLGIQKDHKLIIGSKPNFIGKEKLIIKAIDTEDYFDVDTIVVNVISLTELFIYIFPNPIAGELVSFIVYATDSLLQVPQFSIIVDDNVYNRELKKIPQLFAWKSDFQFPKNISGTALIKAESIDRFERSLKKEKIINYGLSTKKTALSLSDGIANFTIQSESFDEDKIIVMVKEDIMDVKGFDYKDDETNIEDDLKYIVGYNIGPTSALLKKPALLSLNIKDIPKDEINVSKIGFFKGDYYGNNFEYVSTISSKDINPTFSINKLGRYFTAVDDKSPFISIFNNIYRDNDKLIVPVECVEKGSGIDINNVHIMIDGLIYRGIYDINKSSIAVSVDWDKMFNGKHTIYVQISDKIGNKSIPFETEFEIDESFMPKIYRIYQNYPNPFNAETTIKYQIPHSGNVEVVVYSILGQKIKTIVNEYQSAGFYSVKWDGTNDLDVITSSGIYICILKSGDFKDSFKMILLK